MPVSRLFVEIGGDTSNLDKALKSALDNVSKFDVSIKQTGQRFIASFQDMINPTGKLLEQLQLLQMAGIKNETIWAAVGEQWKVFADQANKYGQEIPAYVRGFLNFGKSIDDATQKANALAEAEKKEAEAVQAAGAAFDKQINPTKELGRQIELLQKAGKSQADIWKIYKDQMVSTADAARKNGQAVDPVIQKYLELNGATAKTGLGIEKLGQLLTDFARNPLQAAQSGMMSLLESMGPMAVGIGGIATAAALAGAAIFKMGSDAADAAEQIQNLSASTGMSVEDVQALQRLSAETGVSDLTRKIELLNIQLGKGAGGEFTEAILKMNIAVKQGGGAIYYLEEMRKKLAEIPNVTDRAEQGAAALGRRLWHDLAPLLMNTSKSITESMDQIKKSSAVMTESEMEGLTELDQQLDEHGRAWVGLKNTISILTGEITLAVVKMIEKIDLAAPFRGMAYGISAITGGTTKAAAAVPTVRDLGVMPPTTVQGRAYEEIAKENSELERRLALIAKMDAIASGERGKLLDLTLKLKEVEKQRQEIAKDAKGLQFDEKRLELLSRQSAELKQAIEATRKNEAELEKARKEQEKAAIAAMERERLLNDDTRVYGTLVKAAADYWEKFVKPGITEARKEQEQLNKLTEDFGKIKPRPLFEEAPTGQTFEDFKNSLPAINKEIDTFVAKNENSARDIAEIWRNQVSTIVTDWSRGIADILIEGGDFGRKLTDIFKETAKSILRMLIEQLFNPLKDLFSNIFGKIFGGASAATGGAGFLGSLGGILGTAAGGVATGGLLGTMIPQTTSGKILGGIGGGLAGYGAYGAYMGATTGGATAFTGISAAMASIPVWGWAALGATAIGTILYKIFTKSSVEAGAMEAARDLGGINIGESTIKSFYSGLGLTDKQSYGVRKDLLTSPAFISQIAVPAAESQGRLDALLKSLEKVTVDTRIAASGYLNFRAAVEQGIKTGNWEAFNKQWSEAFAKSQALTAIMPDFASKLAAVATAASDAADAATGLSSGMQGLLDAILSTQDAADDMYGTFLRTGEILPQLATEIQKYGGNLEVFQRYASLGGLRENLTAIGNLISGLNDILPDLDPIRKLLSGGGIDWTGLQGMNIDPSKLIPMADLIAFETKWEDSVKQFQDTGKLLSGSVLQQAVWKFGGAQGMTALQNYGQGFNTITPGLLDMTKSAMDAAYKTERATTLDYLKGVQASMESQIEVATDAIVEELRKILAAIEAGNTATVPVATATTTPQAVASQGGMYFDMRGATVYGYDDFQARVNQAVKSEYYRGGMAYAIP